MKRLLRHVRRGQFEAWPPRLTFALEGLHKNLRRRFNFRGGTFFEAGANDGLNQSNTAYLERYLGWRGILVEAAPHKFVECVKNRPAAQVVHAALVPLEHDGRPVAIRYSNLMSVSEGSDLDAEAHTKAGERFLGGDSPLAGQVFYSPARTIDSILSEAGCPQIDLLSLDIEGAELSALKGIDFSRSRPRYFLIEARDPGEMDAFMGSHGYRFIECLSHHDRLYAA